LPGQCSKKLSCSSDRCGIKLHSLEREEQDSSNNKFHRHPFFQKTAKAFNLSMRI